MIEAGIISQTDACEMILRGKVAYLFNKYSQQYLITNLLFCHHDVKSEVVTLSSLLKGWVENTIGETSEKREPMIEKKPWTTGGLSVLRCWKILLLRPS